MRGSLQPLLHDYNGHGIIPAHAGLTCCPSCSACRSWDHPRACGAHSNRPVVGSQHWGSSPRMRGSPVLPENKRIGTGIIPAHAGLTICLLLSLLFLWDHPRACGAHSSQAADEFCLMGSSPRMRGSHGCAGRAAPREGIIPAHAGLTSHHGRAQPTPGDHPRACGAHSISASVTQAGAGIIPAHAGLTSIVSWRRRGFWDHPRACGAHRIKWSRRS